MIHVQLTKQHIASGEPKSTLVCPIGLAITEQHSPEKVVVGYTKERKIWLDDTCYKGATEKDQQAIESFITRFDSPYLELGEEFENGFDFSIKPS